MDISTIKSSFLEIGFIQVFNTSIKSIRWIIWPHKADFEKQLRHAVNVIRNMDSILSSGRTENKLFWLVRCSPKKSFLTEKIVEPIHLIKFWNGHSKILMIYTIKKRRNWWKFSFFFFSTRSRDRTGTASLPLVFETSASTNSAIRAVLSLQSSAGSH